MVPRIIIIYDSKTGNTERMAKAIEEGVQSVRAVEVELHKIGAPFSMRLLEEADAIVLGSPTEYGNVTSDMRAFIQSAVEFKAARKLQLRGKIGGAFGSYGWDGGWAVDRLGETMKELGIKLVLPAVSAVGHMEDHVTRIDENFLQKCREFGRGIAERVAKT